MPLVEYWSVMYLINIVIVFLVFIIWSTMFEDFIDIVLLLIFCYKVYWMSYLVYFIVFKLLYPCLSHTDVFLSMVKNKLNKIIQINRFCFKNNSVKDK